MDNISDTSKGGFILREIAINDEIYQKEARDLFFSTIISFISY